MDIISPSPTGKFTDPWYSLPGVVYFIAAGSGCDKCRSVKIGVTTRKSLLRRLRAIQSSNHTRIRLLRIIEIERMLDAEKEEAQIHRMFETLSRSPRGAVGSEWFEETPELMAYMNQVGKPLSSASPTLPDAENIIRLFGD